MRKLVVGIDPSTHSTGFAAFDPDSHEIIFTRLFTSNLKDARRRVKEIADQVCEAIEGIDPDLDVYVYSENTVMRGVGGATFQRCIGAIHSRVPKRMHLDEIQNSTVKKMVGGHGQADKLQVAQGLIGCLWKDNATKTIIECLIKQEAWDVTDALAIGYSGYARSSERTEGK